MKIEVKGRKKKPPGKFTNTWNLNNTFFLKKIDLFIFRERRREEEKHEFDRETSTGFLLYMSLLENEPATQACALTGNRTGGLFLLRGTMPNQWNHMGQAGLNSTFLNNYASKK